MIFALYADHDFKVDLRALRSPPSTLVSTTAAATPTRMKGTSKRPQKSAHQTIASAAPQSPEARLEEDELYGLADLPISLPRILSAR